MQLFFSPQRLSLLLVVSLFVLLGTVIPQNALAQQTKPAEFRSRNFAVMTDIGAERAEKLLVKLETMLSLVEGYFGRRNSKPIRMFVMESTGNFAGMDLNPQGVASVATGGGLTITQKVTLGRQWKADSIVYAIADEGTPQHEAVHAYCANNFGSTGPTWYSEGMAEVGNYFKGPKDYTVNAKLHVIEYLKSGAIKPLKEVVDLNQFTGDSWQNYAWRWSICHLLGFNPNYQDRFKPLGLALMTEQQGVTFWTVYGPMAKEIEFEYRLFITNLCPGYRVDLCAWDWKTKTSYLSKRRGLKSSIDAKGGWQSTRVKLRAREQVTVTATGTWDLSDELQEITAKGNEQGEGELMGAVLTETANGYELSEPFSLDENGSFTAPSEGVLVMRCKDDWGSLADNRGSLKLVCQLKAEE